MSDLFNQEIANNNDFNPDWFVRSLCEDKKINITNYCEINFMPGWKNIVEELLTKLGNYSINIIEISDAYSQLDISFSISQNTKEVIVWRAIERARRQSRSRCALCGGNTSQWDQKKTGMFCKACNTGGNQKNNTGTWLDKY